MVPSATALRLQAVIVNIRSEKSVVVLGRVIEAFGSIVFLKMLSSLANKSDVGAYLLASSYLTMVLTVSFSAFDQGFLRNVTVYRKEGSLAARHSAMLLSYLGLSVLLSALCAALIFTFETGKALQVVLLPLSAWLTFEALKNLNLTLASGLRARMMIAVASTADYGCRLALLWALYHWGSVSTPGILYVLAVAAFAVVVLLLFGQRALLSRFRWHDARTTLIDTIRFSWPMIIWGMFGWLQNMSNRWMLSRFADLSVVAEYGVLVAIASFPVTALLGLVVTYVVPILYERESAKPGSSRPVVRRVTLGLLPICGLLVLVAAVWHRELVALLSGPNYAGRSDVLPFITGAACVSAVCSVLTYSVYAQRRVATLLIANTVPGAFSLCFGYFAVGRYQFYGAILTLILAHIAAGALYCWSYLSIRGTPSTAAA